MSSHAGNVALGAYNRRFQYDVNDRDDTDKNATKPTPESGQEIELDNFARVAPVVASESKSKPVDRWSVDKRLEGGDDDDEAEDWFRLPRVGPEKARVWSQALGLRQQEQKKQQQQQQPGGHAKGEVKMKFSHSLQFNAVPDWSAYYIAYSNLKKL